LPGLNGGGAATAVPPDLGTEGHYIRYAML